VTVWTVHVREGRPVVVVPERFSLWAMLFGPLWLLAHRAWIPAVLVLSAFVAAGVLLPGAVNVVLTAGLAWLVGLSGQDMRRWSLARQGYALAHVVAAGDMDAALGRLYVAHPGLAEAELTAGARGAA